MFSRLPARYRLVALCFCAVFVCYIDRVNISVAAIAMGEELGWTDTTKGLVLSSFFVGYLAMQVGSGWLANRLGGRLILGAAVLWWSVFTLLTPLAAGLSLAMLIATRIALGLGEAATFPASYTLFRRWVPPAERSRAVAALLSGIPCGTLFALIVSGWVVQRFGWEAVFYGFGLVGFVWAGFWFAEVRDDPEHHPRIAAEEVELLATQKHADGGSGSVPWRELLSHGAVWALIVNHFCSNWTLYMLLSWLPSYFRDTQGVSILDAGLLSAAPWVSMFVMTNATGWLADRMLASGMAPLVVRKLMQTVGLFGAAGFLLATRNVADPLTAMAMLCGALGMIACTWAGYAPNPLEIAPRHADILMGVSNTFATVPGIIGVAVTGWLVEVTGTYAAAFALAAGVSVFGAVVWLAFARAEPVIEEAAPAAVS